MIRIIFSSICISLASSAYAGDGISQASEVGVDASALLKPEQEEPRWGVSMGLRYAKIPFATKDDTVTDIFPMFYYEGERFFLRGQEAGVRLWGDDQMGVNLLGRYRFFDIPKEFQNEIRGDALDAGLQAYWMLGEKAKIEVEVLSDMDGRVHAVGRLGTEISGKRWTFTPEVELQAKTSYFNSRYYGLDVYDVDAGVELRGRVKGRRHVWRNLYLEGSIEAGMLDNEARNSPPVNTDIEWEAYVGFGFYEAPDVIDHSSLEAKPYWRLSQGWGTSSSLSNIIHGDIRTENVDVDMTSLFYGHPLSDTLFGLPIEVYLTPGIVHHYSSSAQNAATEYVLAVKFYYTFPLPWRVRFGAAEGISYTDSISYYEAQSMQEKGYRASKLLNYLDISLDLNLGDVFQSNKMEDLWLGYGIHHRSGIFESSSAFGRISGGSNFNTLYLQWSSRF